MLAAEGRGQREGMALWDASSRKWFSVCQHWDTNMTEEAVVCISWGFAQPILHGCLGEITCNSNTLNFTIAKCDERVNEKFSLVMQTQRAPKWKCINRHRGAWMVEVDSRQSPFTMKNTSRPLLPCWRLWNNDSLCRPSVEFQMGVRNEVVQSAGKGQVHADSLSLTVSAPSPLVPLHASHHQSTEAIRVKVVISVVDQV